MSLRVEDVMVKELITIDVSASALEAAEIMNMYDIGCLIVMEEGRPVGIVTERDMLKRVLLQQKDPSKTGVMDFMSRPLLVSTPKAEIRDAVRIMNERRIKRLPVVEGGNLLGLVSLTDIVRSLAYFEHAISSLCARCQYGKQETSTEPEQVAA